jgi:hypothetical protein
VSIIKHLIEYRCVGGLQYNKSPRKKERREVKYATGPLLESARAAYNSI